MNKKLLAIAVGAAITAPMAAAADVQVYGRIQVEYNVEDRDGGVCSGGRSVIHRTSADSVAEGVPGSNIDYNVAVDGTDRCDSRQSVDDNGGQSRIGIKASEKLGNGLTAFVKAEFRIDPADNSDSGTGGSANSISGALGQRDIHAGIKGKWGSIAAGSFNSPYKTAGGVKWDPWTATHLQARRAGGMSGGPGIGGHNGFMRNAIYYTSPKLNGFQGHIAFSPDETNSSASNNTSEASDNDFSVALHYKNGPWHAIVAHNRDNRDDDDGKMTKVGLRWKSGNHTIAGQYEWLRDGTKGNGFQRGAAPGPSQGGDKRGLYLGGYSQCRAINEGAIGGSGTISRGADTAADCDMFWLNYQYKMGNNIFSISYGNNDVDSVNVHDGPEFDYWALGWIHKFSKKTRVFAGYTMTDADSFYADRDAWTLGIRKDF